MSFATGKIYTNFLFKMGKSKFFILTIFASSRALICLEQEMIWIVGISGESAYNKWTSFFLFLSLE